MTPLVVTVGLSLSGSGEKGRPMETMELPDLFDVLEEQPEHLKQIVDHYVELLEVGDGDGYQVCAEFLRAVERIGYTFCYGLDGVPYGLRRSLRAGLLLEG